MFHLIFAIAFIPIIQTHVEYVEKVNERIERIEKGGPYKIGDICHYEKYENPHEGKYKLKDIK